jgi:surfactin synthase thioesterase subunit
MSVAESFPQSPSHPFPRQGGDLRLFCFPYAGAGASVFRDWTGGLAAHLTVHPVQLPGREERIGEAPVDRLTPLVQTLCDEMAPSATGPYALFGHSLGALIAFETAREMRRRGHPEPVHLFVSGHGAPQRGVTSERISHLPEAALKERLRRFGGTPEAVLDHPELMALFLPIIRADFAVTETYRYREEPPLAAPITAFGGERDAQAPVETMGGWRRQTRDRFTLHEVPGDHFFVHSHRDLIWDRIRRDLKG